MNLIECASHLNMWILEVVAPKVKKTEKSKKSAHKCEIIKNMLIFAVL